MKEFLDITIFGNVVSALIATFCIWLLKVIFPSFFEWEYHLKDNDSISFPEQQGFKKDHTGQYCRKGMYWDETEEVPEKNVSFKVGRDYKFLRTKWLKKKVCVYRQGNKKKIKAYIMFPS